MKKLGISLGLVILFFCAALLPPVLAQVHRMPAVDGAIALTPAQADGATADQAGRQRYEAGQYAAAIAQWEAALADFVATGQTLQQAMTLSNLSLAHQQLGQWSEADSQIQAALALVENLRGDVEAIAAVAAQVLDVYGRLQLMQGQATAALATWERAAERYAEPSNRWTQNRLNQARALQTLGLYPQARLLLEDVNQTLAEQPDTPLKLAALQSLGQVLRITADLKTAREVMETALRLAETQANPAAIAAIQLSLGDVAQTAGDTATALEYYAVAASTAIAPLTQTTAQLRQLALYIDAGEFAIAQSLWPTILSQLETLPAGRPAIAARVELGRHLIDLVAADPAIAPRSAELLVTAIQQAQALADPRWESYGVGTLGELYAQTQQFAAAEKLMRQALRIAEAIAASDISYRWQWQLGRILAAQGDREGALSAYQSAVNTLEGLRRDLVAINPDVQFSFREDVEPVYRELVDLLLQAGSTPESAEVRAVLASQSELRLARDTMEKLQIAELDNYFREACLVPTQNLDFVVDQMDPSTAFFYTILLPDRLEVILKVADRPLIHRATLVSQREVESTIQRFQDRLPLEFAQQETRQLAQTLESWLIQPVAAELAASEVKTLVFVLDGALRNVPLAALHNGESYLIERYAIALTPGLQLTHPQAIEDIQIEALAAGLTNFRSDEFVPLPHVERELADVQSVFTTNVLLNEQFTADRLQQQANTAAFTVLHLATHGQFSSQAEDTFIVAWDRKIGVNDLDDLLRDRDQTQAVALELLVLSACQTAEGDDRAALGLAGMAVRAGARSTLASLWTIPDESTAVLMREFYRALKTPGVTRAEALRRAQLALLRSDEFPVDFKEPRRWAAFVLLGSWL